jgi:hypothetical protein
VFALTRLLTAVSTLADNLNVLAATVAEINGGLRGRLALDGTTPAETAVLTHQAPQDGTDGTATGNGPAERSRRGRKAQDAA